MKLPKTARQNTTQHTKQYFEGWKCFQRKSILGEHKTSETESETLTKKINKFKVCDKGITMVNRQTENNSFDWSTLLLVIISVGWCRWCLTNRNQHWWHNLWIVSFCLLIFFNKPDYISWRIATHTRWRPRGSTDRLWSSVQLTILL